MFTHRQVFDGSGRLRYVRVNESLLHDGSRRGGRGATAAHPNETWTKEKNMKRTCRILTAAAAVLAILALPGTRASAATATGTITVTASVAKQCSLGSP